MTTNLIISVWLLLVLTALTHWRKWPMFPGIDRYIDSDSSFKLKSTDNHIKITEKHWQLVKGNKSTKGMKIKGRLPLASPALTCKTLDNPWTPLTITDKHSEMNDNWWKWTNPSTRWKLGDTHPWCSPFEVKTTWQPLKSTDKHWQTLKKALTTGKIEQIH